MSEWIAKVDGVDYPEATHINRLQDEKLDRDGIGVIYPEEWGAKGDGSTDDWAAFDTMFTYIKNKSGKRVKVILNPEDYYSIQSRKDATNVFLIESGNLIMEGPGMNWLRKTFCYEGANTVTNFFSFTTDADFLKLSEFFICGGGNKDTSKITNMIKFDETLFVTLERLYIEGCTGYGTSSGGHWMTNIDHCIVDEAAVGFGGIITTAQVENCYAVNCTIGFEIWCSYGVYEGCACDHADIAYELHVVGDSVTKDVALIGCGCENCDQGIKGRAGSLSVQGFYADSSETPAPEAFIEITQETKGIITGFQDQYVGNTYLIKTTNSPNLLIGPEFTKDKIFEWGKETESPEAPQILGRDRTGHYQPVGAASDFKTLCETIYAKYNSSQLIKQSYETGTGTFSETVLINLLEGYGFLRHDGNYDGNVIFEFTQAAGSAIKILHSHIPMSFEKIHFKQKGTDTLFYLQNIIDLQFLNCTFESNQACDVFEVDADTPQPCKITIDKATMDNMVTANWTGLINVNPQDIIFTGYTAAPGAGYFDKGCRVIFEAPNAGGHIGAICTTAGAPGTWKTFGAISAA